MQSLGRKRDLVKQLLRRQVDRQLKNQVSLFSEILGKPIPNSLFSTDRSTLRNKVERWIDNAFDTFGKDWDAIPLDKKRKKLALFLDKQFRHFGRVPKRTNALVYYRKQIEDALTAERSSQFAATYNRYSKATGWLVRDLFRSGRIGVAQEFFVKFAKSEEGFSLAQLFAQQVLPGCASLERLESKHLNSPDIHKLAKLYLSYSGAFEKIARILEVLNGIRKLEVIDYESLSKKSMAELEREIQKEHRLRVLLPAFNRHIRNSIAHHSYTIHVSAKKVTFRDRAKRVSMTWHRFREETSRLSVLVMATSVTTFLHFLLRVLLSVEKVVGLRS